jgi:hypothetical protein
LDGCFLKVIKVYGWTETLPSMNRKITILLNVLTEQVLQKSSETCSVNLKMGTETTSFMKVSEMKIHS